MINDRLVFQIKFADSILENNLISYVIDTIICMKQFRFIVQRQKLRLSKKYP